MHVLARLGVPLSDNLRRALNSDDRLTVASGSSVASCGPEVDLVVYDPREDRTDIAGSCIQAFITNPQNALLIYTALSAEVIRFVLELAVHRPLQIAFAGYDDAPARLRWLMGLTPSANLARVLADQLQDAIVRLPPPIATAVRAHLTLGRTLDHVDALARVAGIPRRSLDRWVARAGFVSTRRLIATPHLVRAYCWLRHDRLPIRSVARQSGFGSQRALKRQVQTLLGVQPCHLRSDVTPQVFVSRVKEALLRHGARQAGENGGLVEYSSTLAPGGLLESDNQCGGTLVYGTEH